MTGRTQTQANSKLQLFDQASSLLSTQPEASLALFRTLSADKEFPHRLSAAEQYGVTLWMLGRYEEACEQYRQIIGELDNSQSYFKARLIVRYGEIALGPIFESSNQSVAELNKWFDFAEQTFAANADLPHLGKVTQLKGTMSAIDGNPVEAEEQITRGRRIVSSHIAMATTGTRSPAGVGTPELAGASSYNN